MPFIVTPGKLNRRAELYHQLGSLLSAGIPLIDAMHKTRMQGDSDFTAAFIKVNRSLRDGETVAKSLQQVADTLPAFDIALLVAGEQSGRMEQSFKLLARYYSTRARLVRNMVVGLLPTLATVHIFLLIFPLSFLVAAVWEADWWVFLMQKLAVFIPAYAVVFGLIFASQGNRSETVRSIIEAIANCVPLLRTARKYLALSRLSSALEALISAGLPVTRSWQMAAAASGSPAILRTVSTWPPHFEAGETPSELVNGTHLFPEMFANMYMSGEVSGQLDDTLGRLHVYFEEEGFRKLAMFNRIFNGIIYGIVALFVAYTVISFYAARYGALFNEM